MYGSGGFAWAHETATVTETCNGTKCPRLCENVHARDNLAARQRVPTHLIQTIYCARGQAENLIKQHKAQLSSDRTSCRSPVADQMRLILHTGAYSLYSTCVLQSRVGIRCGTQSSPRFVCVS